MTVDRSYLGALADASDPGRARRDRNREAKRCINDTNRGSHGLATHGCRCYTCHLVHKHGAIVARRMLDAQGGAVVQPDTRFDPTLDAAVNRALDLAEGN